MLNQLTDKRTELFTKIDQYKEAIISHQDSVAIDNILLDAQSAGLDYTTELGNARRSYPNFRVGQFFSTSSIDNSRRRHVRSLFLPNVITENVTYGEYPEGDFYYLTPYRTVWSQNDPVFYLNGSEEDFLNGDDPSVIMARTVGGSVSGPNVSVSLPFRAYTGGNDNYYSYRLATNQYGTFEVLFKEPTFVNAYRLVGGTNSNTTLSFIDGSLEALTKPFDGSELSDNDWVFIKDLGDFPTYEDSGIIHLDLDKPYYGFRIKARGAKHIANNYICINTFHLLTK